MARTIQSDRWRPIPAGQLYGEERPYSFSTVDELIEDFIAEVEKRRAP